MTWTEAVRGAQNLQPDEIQVWQLSIQETPPDVYGLLFRLLCEEEVARAERFVFVPDCERFVIARGTLRLLLGQVLQTSPERLRFVYGPQGKPSLAHHPHLCFNVSHSADRILIALAYDRQIGVDVEAIRPREKLPLAELGDLAETVFSPAELADWLTLSPKEKIDAFYTAWTHKEAFLKAVGSGFTISPDLVTQQSSVSVDASVDATVGAPVDVPAEISADTIGDARRETRGNESESNDGNTVGETVWGVPSTMGQPVYRAISLDVGAGYKGALAAEGRGWKAEIAQLCFD